MPGRAKDGRPKSDAKQTVGTRRGNGPGWGGARRGEGHKFTPGDPLAGRPVGVATGEGKRAMARAALEDSASLAVQTLISVASDASDQRAVSAAVAILNRVGLHEKHGVEVGGDGGGPVKIRVEIVDATDGAPGGPAAIPAAGQD
jgi:hypothetical protein